MKSLFQQSCITALFKSKTRTYKKILATHQFIFQSCLDLEKNSSQQQTPIKTTL